MGEGCGEFARRDDGFSKRGVFVVRGHGAVGSYIFRHVAVGIVGGEIEFVSGGVGADYGKKPADTASALQCAIDV